MSRRTTGAALAACLFLASAASAHPMGNFAICHYTRLRAEGDGLHLRFVLDLAEIPTVGEKRLLDRDGNGVVTSEERAAYLAAKAPELLAGLSLTADSSPLPLRLVGEDVRLAPGAAGLEIMTVVLDLFAPLPPGEVFDVFYQDRTYETRTGWKEIIAVAGTGAVLRRSNVPSADRSRELTEYPPDVVPPQDTEASLVVARDSQAPNPAEAPAPPAPSGGGTTPRDAFTEAISRADLGPGVVGLGLGIAFAFGALHALSPGHGKAMVAAYLVGSRSTMIHAVLLGAIVTITHTLGVFALGLATLLASRYVVPERLYPILSGLSGLTVCGLGLWLLQRRVRRLLRGPAVPKTTGGHGHHQLPEGPITARALVALGVSGGIIPCPSALVVLLAAVALHRIAYGMFLITAFSFGLASVLVALGLLVVRARRWLEGFQVSGALLRRIPVVSAATITAIGAALVVRALGQFAP